MLFIRLPLAHQLNQLLRCDFEFVRFPNFGLGSSWEAWRGAWTYLGGERTHNLLMWTISRLHRLGYR